MHRKTVITASALLASALSLGGCSEASPSGPDILSDGSLMVSRSASVAAGAEAFLVACASCHTSRDGADLALFGFSDRDIVRRAVFHVDSSTATQILDYIRSLEIASVPRNLRPFQVPRVATDEAFAQRLFGGDYWPSNLGEAGLLAMDPAKVAAAVIFPLWSDEESDLDWMGNVPLSPHVLDHVMASPREAIDAYYSNRSDARLIAALKRARSVLFDTGAGACATVANGALRAPQECFDQLRWLSNLGAQHVLRRGSLAAELPASSTVIQAIWWDVGQAARRSLVKNGAPVPQAEANWVSWMYLGWVHAPGSRPSVYTAQGLNRVGLPRHATFVAVRSLVSRPTGSAQSYADLRTTASVAPLAWLESAAGSAVISLESRASRGWEPSSAPEREAANKALEDAIRVLTRRLGEVRAKTLITRIRALLLP